MTVRHCLTLASIAVLGLLCATASAAARQQPLVLLGRTNFPGYNGDVDHLFADLQENKLFVAAEDHGTVEVFNLRTGRLLKTLTTFKTPHAFFLVPGTHRIIVTDDAGPRMIDDRNYQLLGHLKLHPSAGSDTEYYDPSSKHLFIVSGGTDVHMKHCWLSEIDPWTGRVLRQHEFDSAHVEALRAEQHGERIFINIADRNEVEVLNKRTLGVVARWPIVGAKTNLAMSLDEAHHRLFVVTRNPTRLLVLDTRDGATVATLPVPPINDGTEFDVARQRLYVPGAVGRIGVVQEIDPEHFRLIAAIPSAVGAKSSTYVPQLSELFLGISPQYSKPELAGILRFKAH
ncbi:MAG: YncE family protein [Steroidobacteraceae bacterium]